MIEAGPGGAVYMRALVALTAVAAIAGLVVLPAASASTDKTSTNPYVVALQDGTNTGSVVSALGVNPRFVYASAFTGFAADLTPSQVASLKASPAVVGLSPDAVFHVASQAEPDSALSVLSARSTSRGSTTCTNAAACQVVPNGVRYIHADSSPTAQIDGVDQRVDADVAVVDSGIDITHPDLNVVGGYSCVAGRTAFEDQIGHGTAVAGVIGALDNSFGVVGVAPGVRLWSVRVLDDQGNGTLSDILCGLDWVTRHAKTFDAVNRSIERLLSSQYNLDPDDHNCGHGSLSDVTHMAVCKLVSSGVTLVVAAGNYSVDSDLDIPAGYPEVITVSALADFDGVPYTDKHDPHASQPCDGGGTYTDDTFAFFSNYGDDVDYIAPGVCVLSAYSAQAGPPPPTCIAIPQYCYFTGTSFAAPHVAGAAALIRAHNHTLTPDQVRAQLTATATTRSYPGDPDGIHEPTVDAGSL